VSRRRREKLPSWSANYAGAGRGARPRRGRPSAPPRVLSTTAYLLTTALLAAVTLLGVWWVLVAGGYEEPWLPSAIAAGGVLVGAVAAREVLVRRAWARYTRGLELEMGRGEAAQPAAPAAPARHRAAGRSGKSSVRAAAESLRTLQQRLAQAEEAGLQQPAAHLEAIRLCDQYLASTADALRDGRGAPEVRVALRAGQERVRELRKHHLLSWVRGEARRLTQEAQRRAAVSAKIETAERAFDVIGEALREYPGEAELRDSAAAVRTYIASVKVAHWVELAERAAFRGRFNRAVARYRDALYYLSRAEMAEEAREAAAQRINREIEMLRARIATGEGAEGARPRRKKIVSDG
jgi:hypothetical protein